MTTSKQQLRTDTVLDIKLDPNSGPSKALFKSVGDISKAGFREIPIIDFALSQLDPAEYNRKLITACADVGFLVLQNVPGFEQEFQDQVLGQGHTFFNLPEDVKLQTDIRKSKHLRGSARQDKVKDLRLNINLQAYHFGYEQPECTDPAAPLWKRILNGSNQWPDKKVLPKFRTIIEEYHRRCEHLGRTLGKQICRALGADEKYFTRYFDDVADPTDLYFLGTLNYYPSFHEIPVERRQEVEEGFVRGMYAHRDDQSWITMLIQDAPGLEVLSHDGNWVDVPVLPGSVVVNLGLVLSDATGGALQATTHRVNSMKVTKNRMTAPYFLVPALDVPILPIPHSLPKKRAAVDPLIVLSNAIADPSLRFCHRRLATMYANAEKYWPKEWELLRELLESSQKVYLLTAKLQRDVVHGNVEGEEWKGKL